MAVPIVAGSLTLVEEILVFYLFVFPSFYSFFSHSGVYSFLFDSLEPLQLGIIRKMSHVSISYPVCFTSCFIFFTFSSHLTPSGRIFSAWISNSPVSFLYPLGSPFLDCFISMVIFHVKYFQFLRNTYHYHS